jgi:MerR family transcriptional regulator, thiopeptide resistance regulator
MREQTQTWKIGEVAQRTGFTVRTLHHYEQIGLLRPSGRTESNHRLYTRQDIERLQHIASLRALGLSLDAIGQALDQRGALLETLERQLTALQQRREEIAALEAHLSGVIGLLREGQPASTSQLFDLMEQMTMFEKHYTKDQLDQLAKRREELGEDTIKAVEQEWPALMAAVKAAMDAGTDPADPEVQRMAARWKELIAAFTGGDAGIRRSLDTMYEQEPQARAHSGYDPQVAAYIQRAWEAAESA